LTEPKDGGDTTSYAYYPNGSLQTQTLPNGVTANYTYYNNNELHTLENKKGSTILEAYQYAYDGAGNMTAKQDVKGTATYTYTPLNQLATVSEPGYKKTSYTYDASGNRQSETKNSITTTYTVNEQNRLLYTEQKYGSAKTILDYYFYDNAGNVLGIRPEVLLNNSGSAGDGELGVSQLEQADATDLNPTLYYYNDKNQMIEARTEKGTIYNDFNAENLRVCKIIDDLYTYYCYEYDKVIKEQDSTGSVAYNTYGINLISRDLDGTKVYYVYNGHGDVTGLVDSGGTVIASYYYDSFGNIQEKSGNFSNPYRYSGYIYDESSNLYNLNARFYDAKIARFMQEDTYFGNAADPLSLNLYTYCVNNPIRYIDPTGHNASDNVQSAYNAYLGGYISGAEYASYASKQLGIVIDDPSKGKTTTTGNNSGGNTGGGNTSGGGSSGGGSNNSGGGARGVNFGPNEAADWMRTGSGLTFEEFWGVTPYGTAYYNGPVVASNNNTTNSTGSKEPGFWMYGTFSKSSDIIIRSLSYGQSPVTVNIIEPWLIPYNPVQQQATGVKLNGDPLDQLILLTNMQMLTDYKLGLNVFGYVYIKEEALIDIKYPAGNNLVKRMIGSDKLTDITLNTSASSQFHYAVKGIDLLLGVGTDCSIVFNPNANRGNHPLINSETGYVYSGFVPVSDMYIALAHELIHADMAMRGVYPGGLYDGTADYKMQIGVKTNSSGKIMPDYYTQIAVSKEELAVIGLKYNKTNDITENMIRNEHGLELRGGYYDYSGK